ncbi:MAG: SUMF1/EgtB/PvdO family nonheme iron enzyme [Candidatus Marivariicella sp.]
MKKKIILIIKISFFFSCTTSIELRPVSVREFSIFIDSTSYVTDAEKFGWSFIQRDVYNFDVKKKVTWKSPNGNPVLNQNLPVTQISYNDALAYCNWAGVKLPTYKEYWEAVSNDKRPVVSEADSIEEVSNVNIVGNVWDLTLTENEKGEIRLAGGSYLCSINTCHGTQPDRILYVDKETANTHISMVVYDHDK